MACTGANGINCTDYGIVVPCGPEPTYDLNIPKVVYAGPLVVTGTGVTVTWNAQGYLEPPFNTVEFLVTAKDYHGIFALEEIPEGQAGGTLEAFIAFDVEVAVVYKVFARRRRDGKVGDWEAQSLFYGGVGYNYLVDDTPETDYLVMDDYDYIYLVSENVPGPDKWAYNPDGTIMLDPDGYPVEKQ